MWMRAIIISLFSLSATSIFLYQGIECYHAFVDLFKNK